MFRSKYEDMEDLKFESYMKEMKRKGVMGGRADVVPHEAEEVEESVSQLRHLKLYKNECVYRTINGGVYIYITLEDLMAKGYEREDIADWFGILRGPNNTEVVPITYELQDYEEMVDRLREKAKEIRDERWYKPELRYE